MKKIIPIVSIAAAISFTACNQSNETAEEDRRRSNTTDYFDEEAADSLREESAGVISDSAFIRKAAEAGMAEVALGKLAEEKGNDEKVRSFGEQMVKDHNIANENLSKVAKDLDYAIPAELPEDKKQNIQALSGLSGEAFDRAYAKQMVENHRQAVDLYESAVHSAKEPSVKGFAGETLTVIKEHLMHVQKLGK